MSDFSLLLTWSGVDPALPAVLCVSHLDVVAASAEAWAHPPFSGALAEGHVWGRGALDVKVGALALLEAVTHLLQSGSAPSVLFDTIKKSDEGATISCLFIVIFSSRKQDQCLQVSA